MRLLLLVALLSIAVGLVMFATTDTDPAFRSTASVALGEAVAFDDLDDARIPIVDSLPTALLLEPAPRGFDDIAVASPTSDSRVLVLATAPDPMSARAGAERVAANMRDVVLDERRAAVQDRIDEVVAQLDEQTSQRQSLQAAVDDAIREEAIATANVQRAAEQDKEKARETQAAALDSLRSAAGERDAIADAENRLIADRLALEIDLELVEDQLFLIDASVAEDVSESAYLTGLLALSITLATLLAAVAVLRIEGQRP